LISW
jgi:hypothetical protein